MKILLFALTRYFKQESAEITRVRILRSIEQDHRATAWREIFNGGEYGFARNWK